MHFMGNLVSACKCFYFCNPYEDPISKDVFTLSTQWKFQHRWIFVNHNDSY